MYLKSQADHSFCQTLSTTREASVYENPPNDTRFASIFAFLKYRLTVNVTNSCDQPAQMQ